MRIVTHREPSASMIKSEYGEITYLEWCKKEVLRINKAGGSVRLWESPGLGLSMCAVVYK